MKVLAILGSRCPSGQTANAAKAFLKGVEEGGGQTEMAFLPEMEIERCRQCEDNGWGVCRTEGKCVIKDDFAALVGKIKDADAVIVGSPVYMGDINASMAAFMERFFGYRH